MAGKCDVTWLKCLHTVMPALATDQASDAISQQDAILIFIPIIFVWILSWTGRASSHPLTT